MASSDKTHGGKVITKYSDSAVTYGSYISGSSVNSYSAPVRSSVQPGSDHGEHALKVGLVERYVEHYNNIRLNSAVGYITPKDVLAGRQAERNEGTNAENNLKG